MSKHSISLALMAVFCSCSLSHAQSQIGIITTVAGGGPINLQGTQAIIANPDATQMDRSGNLYIASFDLNLILLMDHVTGKISLVAGNGIPGGSGDGRLATQASLSEISDIAVDEQGNLFIACNQRVRRVDAATGVITTVAGNGYNSPTWDGAPATDVGLTASGIALDRAGNLFIAGGDRIRRVDAATGIITTVVGNGESGYGGDGGPAISAMLNYPDKVILDASDNMYISDSGNQRIRRVNVATGIITTVAGNGNAGYSGDGGLAVRASLKYPGHMSLDPTSNLFIADVWNNRVRRVDAATGIIITVAGDGNNDFQGDGGAAISASLNGAASATLDQDGSLFIADAGNNRIRRVDAATGIITTVAGGGSIGLYDYRGDGGPATNAILAEPFGLLLDGTDNLLLTSNNRILRVDAAREAITTVVGNGTTGYSGDFGFAASANLNGPGHLTSDAAGNLYFADTWNHVVRRVDATTEIITTVAGSGTAGYGGDDGPAINARLNAPLGVTVDHAGNLFIADQNNHRIRRVDGVTGIITTVAGNGEAGYLWRDSRGNYYPGDGSLATSALLNEPSAVAIDSSGNLLIADAANNRIRRVDAVTGIITTIVGGGFSVCNDHGLDCYFGGDGLVATRAAIWNPHGFTVDSVGNLFVADTRNNRVRRVDAVTGIIATIVGNGGRGYSGDEGAAVESTVTQPKAVAIDATGNLFIADAGGHRVRRVPLGRPAASLSASAFDFGPIAVNTQSLVQILTVTNMGTALLEFFGISAPGGYLESDTCQAGVAPGGECQISVIFAPTARGTYNGMLAIKPNIARTSLTVSLAGTGAIVTIGGLPQQPLSKDSQGNWVASLTLTNTSAVTITSAQVSKTGTTLGSASLLSAPIALTNLAPGTSTMVKLRFPANAASSGAATAPLRVSGTYSVPPSSGNWTLSFRSVSLK